MPARSAAQTRPCGGRSAAQGTAHVRRFVLAELPQAPECRAQRQQAQPDQRQHCSTYRRRRTARSHARLRAPVRPVAGPVQRDLAWGMAGRRAAVPAPVAERRYRRVAVLRGSDHRGRLEVAGQDAAHHHSWRAHWQDCRPRWRWTCCRVPLTRRGFQGAERRSGRRLQSHNCRLPQFRQPCGTDASRAVDRCAGERPAPEWSGPVRVQLRL